MEELGVDEGCDERGAKEVGCKGGGGGFQASWLGAGKSGHSYEDGIEPSSYINGDMFDNI